MSKTTESLRRQHEQLIRETFAEICQRCNTLLKGWAGKSPVDEADLLMLWKRTATSPLALVTSKDIVKTKDVAKKVAPPVAPRNRTPRTGTKDVLKTKDIGTKDVKKVPPPVAPRNRTPSVKVKRLTLLFTQGQREDTLTRHIPARRRLWEHHKIDDHSVTQSYLSFLKCIKNGKGLKRMYISSPNNPFW